jgi:hypothetical protein
MLRTRSKNDKKKFEMIAKRSQKQLDQINLEMAFLEKAETRYKCPLK